MIKVLYNIELHRALKEAGASDESAEAAAVLMAQIERRVLGGNRTLIGSEIAIGGQSGRKLGFWLPIVGGLFTGVILVIGLLCLHRILLA
jgi:hypothetical protein